MIALFYIIGGIILKIEKVTLKEMEVRSVNGEYETQFYNEETYPVFLTNHALKRGREQGYIETSLFTELAKLAQMEKTKNADGEVDPSAMVHLDENKALSVIYLALIGANKNLNITFDQFLEKYHEGLEETLELYANLIGNLVSSDPNRFAKEFEKVTEKSKKK